MATKYEILLSLTYEQTDATDEEAHQAAEALVDALCEQGTPCVIISVIKLEAH